MAMLAVKVSEVMRTAHIRNTPFFDTEVTPGEPFPAKINPL
jgi:hypothetical protein